MRHESGMPSGTGHFTARFPRIDALFDNLPAGVVIHSTDGRIVSANRLACSLLGHSRAELTGAESTAREWHFMSEDGTRMLPSDYPVNQVLRSKSPLHDLIVGVPGLPDSRIRWLICNAYPEFDEHGELCRVIVCFTDCTDLKYAKQAMQEAEERLRLVVQGSTDAAWDWDLATGQLYYSDRWWNMLGYAPDELPNDAGLWTRLAHPDDQERLAAFIPELLNSHRQGYGIEFRLRHREGHYVPVLSRGYVLRDEHGKARRISGTNTDLSEQKRTEEYIYRLAYFDHLTGLPNRRLLMEQLEQVLKVGRQAGQHGALLLIDLDNFQLLNDTMGHESGDLLLCQAADRLRAAAPDGALLSRFGGDEFALALKNLGQTACEASERASEAGRAIFTLLAEPYQLPERASVNTPSVGIAVFGGDIDKVEMVLKHAELAMYRAKADGRNTMRFFDPDMQAAVDKQASLHDALRDALVKGEFVLYCQPQFDRVGQLSGAEVLVRWQHHERGLLGPNEFIGLAEASGLIVPLGRHVLEESCRALARWAADPLLANVKLAVNVSVHQLRDPDFPHIVAATLASTRADARMLWLELTESVFAEDTEALIQRMHQLRGQGVRLALDDFGTGYSSLAYLRRFPLSALKIDRSFTHDLMATPHEAPIVDAIVAMARKLKLQVIAEGVEHDMQRSYLLDCGCDVFQGYLLGKPMPIEDFERRFGHVESHENNAPGSF